MRSRNFPSLVHALIALTCLFQFRLPLQAQDEPDELFVPRITISGAKVLAKVPLIDDPFLEIGVFPAHFRVRWTIGDPSIIRFFPIPNQSGDGFKASFNRPRTEATVEAKADSVEKERFVWVWGMQCGTTTITGTVIDLDDETLSGTLVTYRVDVGSFRVLDPRSRSLKQPHNVNALVLTPGQTMRLDEDVR